MLKADWSPSGQLKRVEWTWPWARLAHSLRTLDLCDVAIVAGLVSLAIGMWLLAPWLAFAVVGVLLLVIGLVLAVMRARSDLIAAADRSTQG